LVLVLLLFFAGTTLELGPAAAGSAIKQATCRKFLNMHGRATAIRHTTIF
jgi:hypothetical protein